MKTFFKKHDIWTKLLSVMIAIGMWAFVVNEESSLERTVKYIVPITLTGEKQLLENHSLEVISGQDSKVELIVTGTNPNIIKLTPDDFKITLDVSELTEAKTYANLSYQITLPSTSPSLKVQSMRPSGITIRTDKMTTADIPVEATCSGNAPSGYLYGKPIVSPDTVQIYGPESVLDTIKSAYVSVPMNGATTNVTKNCSFQLRDKEGKSVDSKYLSFTDMDITALVNVYKVATLPLKITLRPSPDITASMANVTISPETVQVYGDPDKLALLKEISLGVLDLGRDQTGSEIQREIMLPHDIHLVSGQPSTAKITMQIDGVATRTVNISNITLVDINAKEQKPDVALKTESVQVTLRGKTSILNALSVDDIQVSTQFDSSLLGEGTHDVPLSVSTKTSEVTIVDHTPTVTIAVTGNGIAETGGTP